MAEAQLEFSAEIADLEPGKARAVEHEGRAFLLCNVEGEIFAVSNRCSHAAMPLTDAVLRGSVLECPLHGARFDVRDGAVVGQPARTPLPVFQVTRSGNRVRIHLDRG